jgi:hypothetical protein
MPARVTLARRNLLKPSIGPILAFTPRWSCSMMLLRYFEDLSSIYRSIQIGPDAADLDIGLIDPPGLAGLAGKVVPATLKFRHEALHPAQDRRVGEGKAAFGHHLHQVTEA